MPWIYLPDHAHDTLLHLAYTSHTPPDTILVALIDQASQRTPLLQWPIDLLEAVALCDHEMLEWLLADDRERA